MPEFEKDEIKEEEKEVEETQGNDEPFEAEAEEEPQVEESGNDAEGDTLTPSEESQEAQGEEMMSENGTENEEEVQQPQPQAEKMLTQSQVNELVGRARKEGRESAMRELFGRYGVSGDDELNDIFGRGQAYDSLNDEFTTQGNNYRSAMAENALLKSKIDENRWEDVKLILGGKGLDVNAENIMAALATHPEWRGSSVDQTLGGADQMKTPLSPDMAEQIEKQSAAAQPKEAPGMLRKLGNEATPPQPQMSEEELVKKLYGM